MGFRAAARALRDAPAVSSESGQSDLVYSTTGLCLSLCSFKWEAVRDPGTWYQLHLQQRKLAPYFQLDQMVNSKKFSDKHVLVNFCFAPLLFAKCVRVDRKEQRTFYL